MEKSQLINQVEALQLWRLQAIKRIENLEIQLEQANGTIREKNEKYQKLFNLYMTTKEELKNSL